MQNGQLDAEWAIRCSCKKAFYNLVRLINKHCTANVCTLKQTANSNERSIPYSKLAPDYGQQTQG